MDMIVIPTIGASPYAVGLYRTLQQSLLHGPYLIWILANGNRGSVDEQIDEAKASPYVHVMDTEGMNISEQWQWGFEHAQRLSCSRVHVLNDDVVLNSASIPAMTLAMASDYRIGLAGYDYFPERPLERVNFQRFLFCEGTYREGGVGGFAFCARTDGPGPDPQFEWWGGDDDWVWQVNKDGKRTAVAIGVPVRHPSSETSAITRPELGEAKGRDHARLLAKWGRAW